MRKTYLSLLAAAGLLLAGLALVAVPMGGQVAAQSATQPPATPRADGSIVHIVQEGETLWVIAIRYAPTLGLTPEEALPYLQELNNNPAFLNPGDEVLIQVATTTAEPTAEATAEGTPAADATGEAPPAEEAATATVAAPAATTAALAGTICVAAFHDVNADGQRNEGEALVADAAIALARAGNTVSTYITDGASEPFCFELTQPDAYQLQLYPPAGFGATTEDNWAVSIGNNESYTVSFGLNDAAPATVETAGGETTGTAAADAPATDAATEGGALPSNLGLIVMGVAAVLVVLAVVGVVLLRRG